MSPCLSAALSVVGPTLPGRVVALRFPEYDRRGDAWPYHRRHVRTVHGAVTTLTRDPHAQLPTFALWLDPAARQWWARLPETSARMVAERRFVHALGDRDTEIRTGPAIVTATPSVPSHRVRLTALSPVVIRAHAGRLTRTVCEAENIASTLGNTLAPRLGLPILHRELVPCLVVENASVPWAGRVDRPGGPSRESIGGDGVVRGWTGSVVLDVSPLAGWLLACAVVLGLGGRTSFGFGRIALEEA